MASSSSHLDLEPFKNALLPAPRLVEFREAPPFRVGSRCVVGTADDLKSVAAILATELEKIVLQPIGAEDSGGNHVLELGSCGSAHREAYRIEVNSDRVRIVANTPRGVHLGIQCFLQLADFAHTLQPRAIPSCLIEDEPRFAWRGMHLDVARHFYPIDEVKRLVDLMAIHRMNVLHWHLTDDQGWRLESRRFPLLTKVGARRQESPKPGAREEGDGTPYGGFYTQDEVKELIRYAGVRGIDILPEIDLPGHGAALLAAYPELGSDDIPDYHPDVLTRWGIYPWLLAPKPQTFQFIEALLEEVASLFPFSFLHIGGDEAITDQWKVSPLAQEFIRRHGLGNEDGLFNHFIHFAAKILRRQNKTLIGWDEIIEHAAPKDAVIMVWRNWQAAQTALAAGHNVIMAPNTHTYFDHYQAEASGEPEAIGGLLPLEKVAEFDPCSKFSPNEQQMIIGAQGQLWSEYLQDWGQVEYMALPRMCALAEIVWAGPIANYEAFRSRLTAHLKRLDRLGFNYRPVS